MNKSKKRINVYLRQKTYDLLIDYMNIEDWDMSTTVDLLIYGRLSYLNEEKKKAEKIARKDKEKEEQILYAKAKKQLEELASKNWDEYYKITQNGEQTAIYKIMEDLKNANN